MLLASQATPRYFLAVVEKNWDLGESLVLLQYVTERRRYKVDVVVRKFQFRNDGNMPMQCEASTN